MHYTKSTPLNLRVYPEFKEEVDKMAKDKGFKSTVQFIEELFKQYGHKVKYKRKKF